MTSKKLIDRCGLGKQSHYVLTSTGLFVDTQTITIGGVVLTTVAALSTGPAVPGQIKIQTAALNLAQIVAIIENPYLASNANYTALAPADSAKLAALNLTADTSATVLTISNPTMASIVVAETQTNAAWTGYTYSPSYALSDRTVSVQLNCQNRTSGNGVMTVEVSNDGENFVAYNRLASNATNTNAQTDVRVASLTASANGASIVTIPITDKFVYMRVKIVTTTDGEYSVIVCN